MIMQLIPVKYLQMVNLFQRKRRNSRRQTYLQVVKIRRWERDILWYFIEKLQIIKHSASFFISHKSVKIKSRTFNGNCTKKALKLLRVFYGKYYDLEDKTRPKETLPKGWERPINAKQTHHKELFWWSIPGVLGIFLVDFKEEKIQ